MEFVIPPPPGNDPRRHLRFRETAVELLRQTSRFGRVSRRLLTDLVDVAEHHDLGLPSSPSSFDLPGIGLVVVAEGEVIVEALDGVAGRPGARPPARSFVRRTAESPPTLSPGVYLGNDERWHMLDMLQMRTAEGEAAYVIALSRKELLRWLKASPALLYGVGYPVGYQDLVGNVVLFAEHFERGRS